MIRDEDGIIILHQSTGPIFDEATWDKLMKQADDLNFKTWVDELFPECPDLIPLKQVKQMLGVGRSKVYDLVDWLDTIKVGKEFLVHKRSLQRYVYRNTRFQRRGFLLC